MATWSPKSTSTCASAATRSSRPASTRERICLDPGIGFGKTHEHNITLMANCRTFHALGCPLLVGHSRKGFLGKLIGDKEADRTHATVGAALGIGRAGRADCPRPRRRARLREALSSFRGVRRPSNGP